MSDLLHGHRRQLLEGRCVGIVGVIRRQSWRFVGRSMLPGSGIDFMFRFRGCRGARLILHGRI